MHTLYVDGDILVDRCNALMDGHVKYALGAKISADADPAKVTEIDCSGFTRYIFAQACFTKVHGGSSYQNEWLAREGFAQVKYEDVGARKDNTLRLGYFRKGAGMVAGHIWFVLNGMTLESYSGGTKHGPGRRPWDSLALRPRVQKCYEIGGIKKLEYVGGLTPQCRIVTMDLPDSWD